MHKVTISVPMYLPQWLYRLLKGLKNRLANKHGADNTAEPSTKSVMPINLLGDREIEWSWIASQIPDGKGEALDFGHGGSILGLIAAHRGFVTTAIDLENYVWPYVHSRLRFIKGDILTIPFEQNTFDLVINCSTVEHVGLAGRYEVKEDRTDGDLAAMQVLRRLMNPGGLMLMTIPIGRDRVFLPLHRVYGEERLPRLLDGYELEQESFWTKDPSNRWVSCDKQTALAFDAASSSDSGLGNSYALGCFSLRRPAV